MTGISRRVSALLLVFALTTFPVFTAASTAFGLTLNQTSNANALQRGYRTGYSDGYMAGYSDTTQRAARDFRNKEDYARANRAYDAAYGTLAEYSDGYRQGFEIGYGAGYDRRTFDSNVPTGLGSRAASDTPTTNSNDTRPADSNDNTATTAANGSSIPQSDTRIPANSVFRIELLSNVSTQASQRGDSFEARVVEPQQFQGATINGHVSLVKRPGKVRGSGELQLSFDEIRFADNRTAPFGAQVIEVIAGSSAGVGKVDREGGVQGKGTGKDDAAKVGAGAGLGAIIGAITGGGKGAAIGAVVGGAAGTGGVLASRGQDIYLPRGQQLRIRTANTTRYE
ncbi:MAG: hypothetical protein ABR577_13110 [Pyrinomonadaceae bacterium]